MKYTGTSTKMSYLYITRIIMLYVFYITTTPYQIISRSYVTM